MSVVPSNVPDVTSIETLRAVHHPTRRRMVDYLYLHGPTQVGTLARELEQQVGSISHHLRMLERAGIVAAAPELATDGRTSWWRLEQESVTWSVDDFADAAERMQAKAAQRLNIDHHIAKLSAWIGESEQADPAWRHAAFSSDALGVASPTELAELSEALRVVTREWRERIDLDDGTERSPVFVFTHGFPTRP
jgi:DNA-binding transcriptional ArsR family regulator